MARFLAGTHGTSDVTEEVAPPQAEQLVLGHGNGGESGISIPQQPQTRYYLVPVSNFATLPLPLQIELFGIFF